MGSVQVKMEAPEKAATQDAEPAQASAG